MLNSKAPEFALESSIGQNIRLADLLGSFVVLIFYPMNDTPICNSQLDEANMSLDEFLENGVRVFGVNSAHPDKHKEYCVRRKLQFPILSDPGASVARSYKAAVPFIPVNVRTVVAIDPQGNVCFHKRGKPSTEEILQAIKAQAQKTPAHS